MAQKALVLGGTGLLGFATIEELLKRGWDVVSVALPPLPSNDLFDGMNVESHLADVSAMSDEEVLGLLEGVDAVFYAIGADERVTPKAPAFSFFYEANVLPTQRLARLARQAGVKKFVVYGSYFAHFAEHPAGVDILDEPYPHTRLLQEEIAMAEGEGAMDVMALRLPYIFGNIEGRMPLWKMFVDAMRQTEVYPVHPNGYTAAVTTKQVAQAAVGAAEQGKHRGKYTLGGLNLKLADFYRAIAEKFQLSTQLVEMDYEQLRPQMQALDTQTHEQGLQHGISMEKAAELRALDLSVDPKPVQEALGYEEDDVQAAIDLTLETIEKMEQAG